MHANTMERNRQLLLAWGFLTSFVSIVEVILDGCVPDTDTVLAQNNVSHISPKCAKKQMTAVLEKSWNEREAFSLYTKRERVIL